MGPLQETPSFDSLPLRRDGPRGNAWGLFGQDDQLGMLNRLTPENTIEASKEIMYGLRISTDLPLDQLKTPCFNRLAFHQQIQHKAPRTVNDDVLTLNTQSSSQWDGFRHFGYQDHQVYFNDCKQEDIHNTTKNGINVWVENGGVVGRGILLDYASWAESQGRKLAPFENVKIPLSDLEKVAESQGVSFRAADILFIRSGYVEALKGMSARDAASMATTPNMPGIGVEAGEEMLKWIWEQKFSAVAGDMIAFESVPFASTTHWMHEWLLAGWGIPIGELFDLERLSAECKRIGKWTFFFSSVPLNVPGGVASPPNGVAIL